MNIRNLSTQEMLEYLGHMELPAKDIDALCYNAVWKLDTILNEPLDSDDVELIAELFRKRLDGFMGNTPDNEIFQW